MCVNMPLIYLCLVFISKAIRLPFPPPCLVNVRQHRTQGQSICDTRREDQSHSNYGKCYRITQSMRRQSDLVVRYTQPGSSRSDTRYVSRPTTIVSVPDQTAYNYILYSRVLFGVATQESRAVVKCEVIKRI